jgi:hypothetical protein
MLAAGVPVGGGTDATRVASFNPWVSLYWLVTGNTVGGLNLYPEERQLDRTQALRLWTQGSAWFSGEQDVKGTIATGLYADLAVLSGDYFSVDAEDIKGLASVLTMVGGNIVHGDGEFKNLAPPLPPASPDWSPVNAFGGHYRRDSLERIESHAAHSGDTLVSHVCAHYGHQHTHAHNQAPRDPFWGPLGCGCFAF